jgi:hypothetical protein
MNTMVETGITRQRIIAELSRSPHGSLKEYVDIGKQAVLQEGNFFQHLIAWDRKNGQIRDSKVALPVIGLAFEKDDELTSNSLAHLALLGPRELARAYRFALEMRLAGRMRQVRRLVESYLREKEKDRRWDHFALQHRDTLRELYSLAHVKVGSDRQNICLFGRTLDKTKAPMPKGSIFEVVSRLKSMAAGEAAAAILRHKLPFLVVQGAMAEKMKDPDVLLALINGMTPTELITNTKNLERWGMKNNSALRGAFDAALAKAAESKKNTLKTTAAIEAIGDEKLKDKLRGVQEKQIKAAGGPEGNWLVLADKSGSMGVAIEIARHVAATLAAFVSGKVWLVFFDTVPLTVDVTGLSLDQIKKATEHIRAVGGTSIGVGLNRMLVEKVELDGIAIISDGGENTSPLFANVYKKYVEFVGKDVPVYFYDTYGDRYFQTVINQAGIEMQTFDVRKPDYYSLPNMVKTMRSNQYSLVDEILATPLVSLKDVLKLEDLVAA